MEPKQGDRVLYKANNGTVRPATVTNVVNAETGLVDLVVFTRGSLDSALLTEFPTFNSGVGIKHNAAFSEEPANGKWSWPAEA